MKDKSVVKRQHIALFDGDFGKLPPQAIEAERCVLGAILIDKDCVNDAVKILRSSDFFYTDQHQKIYQAIVELFITNTPIDLLTVRTKLKENGTLDSAGGDYYIAQLTNSVGSTAHTETHCYIIKEAWIKRTSIRIGQEVIRSAYDETTDPLEVLGNAMDEFQSVVTDVASSSYEAWSDTVDAFTEDVKTAASRSGDERYVIGLPTGVYALDRQIMGLCKSNLVIVAGRPGHGKSTLMLQSVRECAKKGIPVAVFSLEMSKAQLVLKLIAMEGSLDITKLRSGTLTKEEWATYNRVAAEVRRWPIYITDKSGLTVNEIVAMSKAWKIKHGIQAVYVDYLQLVSVGDNKRVHNREQEIAYISRTLKGLAKDLDEPVMCLSQMSRDIENRPLSDKRPRNSDLRESGATEQDANEIIFVFRPELFGIKSYDEKGGSGDSTEGVCELIVTKSRLGTLGIVKTIFEGQYSRFVDYDDNYSQSYSSPRAGLSRSGGDTPF